MTTKVTRNMLNTSIDDNGNATAITIDSSENVGIGSTSPDSKLHVESTGVTTLRIRTSSSSSEPQMLMIDGAGDYFSMQKVDRGMTFKPQGAEAMRIDSSGNVLVSKTATSISNTGTTFETGGRFFTTTDGGEAAIFNRKTSSGTIVQFRSNNTTTVGQVASRGLEFIAIGSGDTNLEFNFGSDQVNPSSGTAARDNAIDLGSSSARFDDIFATNNAINTSDQNEKNTITDSDLGLDFINRLSPKSYKFNGKTRTHYGLIAQDVETVLSDISKPTADFAGFIKGDISEEQDGSSYRYGLRYGEFIAPLIKAIQEQQEQIKLLQQQIEVLKNGN